MGSGLNTALPPPLYLHGGWRDLCDPTHHHGGPLLPLHLVQSRKKPPSHTRSGSLSHPYLLTSFPFRCLFSALFPCRAFHPLSCAAHPSGSKPRGDSPSSKKLLEKECLEIYPALSSRHRGGHLGNGTCCRP